MLKNEEGDFKRRKKTIKNFLLDDDMLIYRYTTMYYII